MLQKHITILLIVSNSVVLFSQNWVKKMENPSVNFYDIQKEFNNYWKKQERKEKFKNFISFGKPSEEKSEGLNVYKRWEHFIEPRVYPSGDRSLLNKGNDEIQKILSNPTIRSSRQAAGNWHYIGNTNVPTSGGGAGRINSVRFHPSNPNKLYAGAPAGGLWQSNNAGNSWHTTTDQLPSIGVNDIAVNPLDTNIIYIATGDDNASDTYSVGVLKSTDAGQTWQMTGLTFTANQSRRISRILINPNNPNMIFAGTSFGLFRSLNAGLTWTRVLNANPIKDLEFKPGDPNTVYATSSKSFYRSTNGGANFTVVSSTSGLPTVANVGRLAITVTQANPNLVYLVATNVNSNAFYGVYKSTDQGLTFTLQSNTPNLLGWDSNGSDSGGQGWYTLSIAASHLDENEVVIGGVNIWKSQDGGLSWFCSAHWYGAAGLPYVHADIHDLIYKPNTSELFVGCDGGVFKTINNGLSYTDLSDGLSIAQMYRLGTSQIDANITITGWQDNGTNLHINSNCERVIGGDGMECFIDWSNANYVYGEYQYGEIQRSSNGGNSFNGIKNNISEDGAWVTPWVQDPINPQTLYAGYKNVWKTTNRGNSWTQISSFNSSGLTCLAVAKSNPQYIYASNGGLIFKTTDGGANWNNITVPNVGAGSITYVAVSNTNPDIIWVTRSGYASSTKVNKSMDGGNSWTDISLDLPSIPVNCVVNQTGTNDGIYVGTDLGVYYIDNNLTSWMPFNNGLPNVVIDELEIHYPSSTLRAATYGRGLWETSIYNPASSSPFPNFNADVKAGCPGLTVQFSDSTLNNPTSWLWHFPGGTPNTSTLQNPVITYNTPGTYNNVTLIATNANGTDSIVKLSYIAISPQIKPTIALTNNDTLCAGQPLQLISSFGSTYHWYPTNQGQQSINANTMSNNYVVTVTDIFGCTTVSDTTKIIIYPLPATPIITSNLDTLFSSYTYGNQWFLNGVAIPNATDSLHIMTVAGGTYTVRFTDSISGCSSTSSTLLSIDYENNLGIGYSIFPNPIHDNANITFVMFEKSDFSIEITDVLGKVIHQKQFKNADNRLEYKLDLSTYPQGTYLFTIKNNKGSSSKKIIKY